MTEDVEAADPEDAADAKQQDTASAKRSRKPEPVLPDRSADDGDVGWGTAAGGDWDDDNDERLQRERPPHW